MPPTAGCKTKGCASEEFKDRLCLKHWNAANQAGGRRPKVIRRKVEKNKAAIVDLCSSLRRQPKFAKMVDYSCECLQKLCVDEVSREELVDNGVVETLMHVLSLNRGNEEKHNQIQHAINLTLKAIGVSDDLATEIGDRLLPDDHAAFAHSLAKHSSSVTLQSSAEALLAVARSDQSLGNFVKADGIRAAASVLKRRVGEEGKDDLADGYVLEAVV